MVLSFDSVGRTVGSEYDKLGFLLKLDSKLPPELASKYANFSEGVCRPGYASALMTSIFPNSSQVKEVMRMESSPEVRWKVSESSDSVNPVDARQDLSSWERSSCRCQ
ncbi:unnamed protein product [Caretta caretta]